MIPLFLMILPGCNNEETKIANFKKTIKEEFNFCEVDQDCKIVYGVCPLGCFFIVHNEKVAEVEAMVKEVKEGGTTCLYKCPVAPQTLRCIDSVCYPALEDKYTYFLFYEDCEKIAQLYERDLIGKKANELNLSALDHELLPADSMRTLKKKKDNRLNSLKLFVDEVGVIESVSCYEKQKKSN